MGSFYSKNVEDFFEKNTNILILGLDGVGKKTILNKINFNDKLNHFPQLGFNIQ
jgi:hypothetical protein